MYVALLYSTKAEQHWAKNEHEKAKTESKTNIYLQWNELDPIYVENWRHVYKQQFTRVSIHMVNVIIYSDKQLKYLAKNTMLESHRIDGVLYIFFIFSICQTHIRLWNALLKKLIVFFPL